MPPNSEIQQISTQVTKLTEGATRMEQGIDRIEILLSGNPLDRDDKGMIGRLAKIEEDSRQFKFLVYAISFLVGRGVTQLISDIPDFIRQL